MGKIIEQDGFKVVIRTRDHEPPHVHVYKAGVQVKLSISNSPSLLKKTRMKSSDMEKAIDPKSCFARRGVEKDSWLKRP